MTEIPEHLLKRAQRARELAQKDARVAAANDVIPKQRCGDKLVPDALKQDPEYIEYLRLKEKFKDVS